ncbi:MAG: hypothetical protein H6728_13500, partial [Myxococcales bacterium]|nr:hypothetical protein [Myxococcales bacterium]
TMQHEQEQLASNLSSFLTWSFRTGAHYQIMVIPSDATATSSYIPGCAYLGAGATDRLITPNTINPPNAFKANAKVGTNGSSNQRGFEVAHKALTAPNSLDPNCNLGFLRKDARLSVIFVSDRTEASPLPVDFYQSFFQNLKVSKYREKVLVSAITGLAPSGCQDPTMGNAPHAPRYLELSQALEGKQASICENNWSTLLRELGALSFEDRQEFPLSRIPDPNTIFVRMGGRTIPQSSSNGWSYSASKNAIIFAITAAPPYNSHVEIDYQTKCLP